MDIWTPHMLLPMKYAWSTQEQPNTVASMVWVHRARHGHINHFWRLAPIGEMDTEQADSEDRRVDPVPEGRETDVRANDGWDWEDRRNNLRPELMERLIEQHGNADTVCTLDGYSLQLSAMTHLVLESATVEGVTRVLRQRTTLRHRPHSSQAKDLVTRPGH